MQISTTSAQTVCNPCKPISQIKRFNAGDRVQVKADGAGFVKGAIMTIYAYSVTPEGLNIIVDGTTPRKLRDFYLYPAGEVKEVLLKMPPRFIAEIPVLTAEEYLTYLPFEADHEARVIPMYPEMEYAYPIAA